jgi:hypothetical protein
MLIHGNEFFLSFAAYTKIKHVYKNKGLISENRHQGVVEATILGDDWRRFGDDSRDDSSQRACTLDRPANLPTHSRA